MTASNDIAASDACELDEIELSDEDIIDAMRRIPGYLDVSTEDFRLIYHLAHANALGHLLGGITVASLMRGDIKTLSADMLMDQAAHCIAESGFKGLPVTDENLKVVGMLTEADFLRRLNASSFLDLMLRLLNDPGSFSHRCHETRVAAAMTSPAVTLPLDASVRTAMSAFAHTSCRGMPVVDAQGRCVGMLLRKDLLMALHQRSSICSTS